MEASLNSWLKRWESCSNELRQLNPGGHGNLDPNPLRGMNIHKHISSLRGTQGYQGFASNPKDLEQPHGNLHICWWNHRRFAEKNMWHAKRLVLRPRYLLVGSQFFGFLKHLVCCVDSHESFTSTKICKTTKWFNHRPSTNPKSLRGSPGRVPQLCLLIFVTHIMISSPPTHPRSPACFDQLSYGQPPCSWIASFPHLILSNCITVFAA